MQILEVVRHNPRWRDIFVTEAKHIAAAFSENIVAIHHIGSTAIPNIYAKPVIDMLVVVRNIVEVEAQSSSMESLGYEVMGEFGISGRRYFRKDDRKGIRTHQIHTFAAGSPEIERHLAFRDYMIAHPDDAQKYSELKRTLAAEHSQNPDGYMDGKDGLINEIDDKAAKWRTTNTA